MTTATENSLDDDYARAGFGAHLEFGARPALVVIDVVEAYVQPGSPLYAPAFVDALHANVRLVAAARAQGVPVIFTNVVYCAGADGADGGVFYKKAPVLKTYLAGSPLAAFSPLLMPLASEIVVSKQYASAFFGTSLASTLTAMKVDTVMLTGFSTSGCVRASTLDAMQHGFTPFVVSDACGDRDQRPHDANLFDLQAKYAEVIGAEEALTLLRKR